MKHQILIVGTGSIGTRHVRCMLNTGRADVGICEPNAELRNRVVETYGITKAYACIDDALDSPWDAAVVSVPAPLHISIARRLVEHDIGVFIEKPLAVNESGVAELVEEVDRRGVPSGVAYVYRAHPCVQAMRDSLQSERFGKPLQLVAVSGQHFPHYRPAYRDIYYAHSDQGGGAIQDALTHTFNACEWLVGPVNRLTVDADHLSLDGVDVEDTVHVMARHNESVMACYAINQHQAPNESSITVVCEAGTLRLEIKHHRWMWMTKPEGTWSVEATSFSEQDDWFIRQEEAFLDHVEGLTNPLCSLREGWQTLRVNRAALASAELGGQWQTVASVPPPTPARPPARPATSVQSGGLS